MFIRQSAGVALLLASLPISAFAQTTKVFIDQDTSGPGGTDSISIAMLLTAGASEPLLQNGESMKMRHALWGPKPGDGWYGNWGDRVAPPGTLPPAPGGPPRIKPVATHAAELLLEMAGD